MRKLEDFLKPTQKELFDMLCKMYKGCAAVCKRYYILVRGEAPILLAAHLDTVHNSPVREICISQDGNVLMSPQGIGGDDRCGVYALATVYEKSKVKPWLLFTCDEETGCTGARKFAEMHRKGKLPGELEKIKILMEIDRKGKEDAVYYNCENPEFEDYIAGKGFKTEAGSFSDISVIAPELGVAAANLSSGYYNAHTLHEYINRRQLDAVVRKVTGIVAETVGPGFPRYEYIEGFRRCGRWRQKAGKGWSAGTVPWQLSLAEERAFLKNVPENIRDDYEALLDYYTVRELEEWRADYGDQIIPKICETESGCSYSRYREMADGETAEKQKEGI